MSSTALPASVAAAFEHLIDYAGLFPPAELDLNAALSEYARAAAGPHGWMLGRFVIPITRLSDVRASIPLSVIVAAEESAFDELDRARESGLYRIEALEVSPGRAQAIEELRERHGWRSVPVFAEVALSGDFEPGIAALASAGLRAKFRCGGTTAGAFPSVETLARAMRAAGEARVAFKATAGLHHPVRHFNSQAGTTMHGFLNVLLAAVDLSRGGARVEKILREEDSRALCLPDAAALAKTRSEQFVSYGSCSFDEPVEDLRSLGLIG